MKLNLTINMENSAFTEGQYELARIFKELYNSAKDNMLSDRKIRDINGNTCGNLEITLDKPTTPPDSYTFEGYYGEWYGFDQTLVEGTTYAIFECNEYGDETCYLIAHESCGEWIVDMETYDDIDSSLKDLGVIY